MPFAGWFATCTRCGLLLSIKRSVENLNYHVGRCNNCGTSWKRCINRPAQGS